MKRFLERHRGRITGTLSGFDRVKPSKHLLLISKERKCLHLYYYYQDREFGLMHIRLETWLPFTIRDLREQIHAEPVVPFGPRHQHRHPRQRSTEPVRQHTAQA